MHGFSSRRYLPFLLLALSYLSFECKPSPAATPTSGASPAISSAKTNQSASIPAAAPTSGSHFVGEDGTPWSQYERTWEKLKSFYGDAMPAQVTVALHEDGSGGFFDVRGARINLERVYFEQQGELSVAHETSHICLAMLTKGASNTESFRFMDEGFAEVISHQIIGQLEQYKSEALSVAAAQMSKGNVAFDKVQRWSEYFGEWQFDQQVGRQRPANFDAYSVGASFDLFVSEQFGESKLKELFSDIGKSKDLDSSLRKVLGRSAFQIEADWKNYLSKVPLETPRVVEFMPSNGAADVPADLSEVYVRFNVPMNRSWITIKGRCDDGICYRNAYWKSPTILAVRIPEKLKSGTSYKAQLGDDDRPLKSRSDIPLPVTLWEFKTK